MEFVQLRLSPYGSYSYVTASSVKMDILGLFLTSNVGCGYPSSFKEWSMNDNWGDSCSGNTVALEKDNNYILLTDLYSEEKVPTVLKLTREQFVQIFDEWQEKVCKLQPKEVIIEYDNDQFIMKMKN